MAQYLRLDRPVLLVYLGLVGGACRSAPGPVVPEGAKPVSRAQVAEWVAATIPAESRLDRFKWLFQDERGSAGGRGSARIVPTDSLRFDVAGPFGSGAASAVVVGDRAVWTEPSDAIARLVPNYPLMWAMFGVARMPAEGAELRGLAQDSLIAWQYTRGSDTVQYARTEGNPVRFLAEVRQAGKLIGRAETTLQPDGVPLKARLTVPSAPAKLDITFLSTTRATFAPDIWLPRSP
ncbi:MAG TPA: hypothetical protein VNO19_00060 [Gemmatimonadales bacterium]|nr:hypothetical protein [Gemmatimonadales bacterium]